MGKRLIHLVSEQMIPIILSSLHIKPTEMVFIRSSSVEFSNRISKITDYLSKKFPFTVQEIVIDPFDFEQIYEKLNETIKLEDIINVTGGTKIMAIAAFQVAMEKEISSLYVDTTNQRLIMLGQDKGEQKYYTISSLRVNQYIELFGGAILEEQTSFFNSDKRLSQLCQLVIKDVKRWGYMNKILHLIHKKEPNSLTYDTPMLIKGRTSSMRVDVDYLQKFKSIGFFSELVIKGNIIQFSYKDKNCKDILLNSGLWLEYYIYNLIKNSEEFDDSRAGVKFAWDRNDLQKEETTITNEIDVMFSRKSILYCISCKAGNISKNSAAVLNEIENYSSKLGGVFHKCGLVLTDKDNVTENLLKRAKQSKIEIFIAEEKDSITEQLLRWIQ